MKNLVRVYILYSHSDLDEPLKHRQKGTHYYTLVEERLKVGRRCEEEKQMDKKQCGRENREGEKRVRVGKGGREHER